MTAPRIDHYDWAGGRETMLRFGPEMGPVAVVALPLFEEANRTRAFGVSLCRALADRGVGSALPDLPGTGESLAPLETMSLRRMSEGYEVATHHVRTSAVRVYGVAFRSGALLDRLGRLDGRWHLAPQNGPDLLRELARIKGAPLGDAGPVEVAGNRIGTALLTGLGVSTPWSVADGGPVRTVRLTSDPRPADRHVPGSALWRRSEPGNHPELALILADDIAGWIARCGG